tara:strand:- start:2205 stop:2741 length:537 start_codon:yes stop_codon:yes gene_type:complete
MSGGNVKVRLKVGVNEVEIEGSTSDIEKTISLIPKMIQALPKEMLIKNLQEPEIQHIPEPSRLEKYISPNNKRNIFSSKPPEIQIDRGDSLSEIITKLFMNIWGRKPRKLGEIREALHSYGQVYPKQSVAVALLRLAQSGRLRRFKDESGEYVYTASTTLAPENIRQAVSVESKGENY